MTILDLGCGFNKSEGAIGVDKIFHSGVDVIHNFNLLPLPFKNNTFDLIIINQIIEHIENVESFLKEIHRVAKPGATIKGVTPHFSSPLSYADPDHKHCFGLMFIKFICNSLSCKIPNPPLFSLKRIALSFGKVHRVIGVQYLANKFLELYEFYFSGLFRARDIYFELEVRKENG